MIVRCTLDAEGNGATDTRRTGQFGDGESALMEGDGWGDGFYARGEGEHPGNGMPEDLAHGEYYSRGVW